MEFYPEGSNNQEAGRILKSINSSYAGFAMAALS
jgi:hypothetical protein